MRLIYVIKDSLDVVLTVLITLAITVGGAFIIGATIGFLWGAFIHGYHGGFWLLNF